MRLIKLYVSTLIFVTILARSPLRGSRLDMFSGAWIECFNPTTNKNASFEELLCLNEKIESHKSSNILEVGDEMKNLIENLRSFVSVAGFDVWNFERQALQLKERLEKLRTIIRNERHEKALLSARLLYADDLFDTMCSSLEPLKHYSSIPAQGHDQLWWIIDLNLRLMAQYDSDSGSLRTDKKFEEYIHAHMEEVAELNDGFLHLSNVSFGVSLAFEEQLQKARRKIERLVSGM